MVWLGDTAHEGTFGNMPCDGQGPTRSPSISDLGHGNGAAVFDPSTVEMKVLGAPMGAGMLWGPEGMHLGKGSLWGLFLGSFWGVKG